MFRAKNAWNQCLLGLVLLVLAVVAPGGIPGDEPLCYALLLTGAAFVLLGLGQGMYDLWRRRQ